MLLVLTGFLIEGGKKNQKHISMVWSDLRDLSGFVGGSGLKC